jgi:hypothetical protein
LKSGSEIRLVADNDVVHPALISEIADGANADANPKRLLVEHRGESFCQVVVRNPTDAPRGGPYSLPVVAAWSLIDRNQPHASLLKWNAAILHGSFSMLTIEDVRVARPASTYKIPDGAVKECGREAVERALRGETEHAHAWIGSLILHYALVTWNISSRKLAIGSRFGTSRLLSKYATGR